jgi:hypothetical protein
VTNDDLLFSPSKILAIKQIRRPPIHPLQPGRTSFPSHLRDPCHPVTGDLLLRGPVLSNSAALLTSGIGAAILNSGIGVGGHRPPRPGDRMPLPQGQSQGQSELYGNILFICQYSM